MEMAEASYTTIQDDFNMVDVGLNNAYSEIFKFADAEQREQFADSITKLRQETDKLKRDFLSVLDQRLAQPQDPNVHASMSEAGTPNGETGELPDGGTWDHKGLADKLTWTAIRMLTDSVEKLHGKR